MSTRKPTQDFKRWNTLFVMLDAAKAGETGKSELVRWVIHLSKVLSSTFERLCLCSCASDPGECPGRRSPSRKFRGSHAYYVSRPCSSAWRSPIRLLRHLTEQLFGLRVENLPLGYISSLALLYFLYAYSCRLPDSRSQMSARCVHSLVRSHVAHYGGVAHGRRLCKSNYFHKS